MSASGNILLARHDTVVHVYDFINQGCPCVENHCRQRRVPPQRFKVPEVLWCHLAAFTGHFS